MNRSKLLYAIQLLLLIFLISSCVRRDGREKTEDTLSYISALDSIDNAESIKAEKKEEEVKQILFPTTESALEYMNESSHSERYNSGILIRMAEENLEYAAKLLNNRFDYFIVVDKAVMKVILYNKYGEVVKEYKCACGKKYGTKHKKADSRTPEGFFEASGIYDSTDWLFTNDNGYTSPAKGQFGPRFIRIKCPNTSQIGIHGTAAPYSIGKRVSHGCIRITNENILDLVKYVKVGMPIIISPGPRDMAVNIKEGYDIKAVTTTDVKVEPIELSKPISKEKSSN